ncbi:class I SAM-dependent methyltransferase [Leptospira alstonii]|uniref:class I SAM-dependent methyltransferase n=1 Tax=Leptospira alstonii TaxID=28452 RepID=UPI0007743C64|nr:class I SAM-dependent methyltransferase [Leptospira alstonii]
MNSFLLKKIDSYPHLNKLVCAVLEIWPAHSKNIEIRFKNDTEENFKKNEELSALILKIIDSDLSSYSEDYKWMCENFIEELLYFRRHDEYQIKTFEEANRKIYSNPAYMSRYVKGILLSQVLWKNHSQAIDLFKNNFLNKNKNGYDHLEIGPGHGLFFYFSSRDKKRKSITGWDVSESSILATKKTLATLGVQSQDYQLNLQDILTNQEFSEQFDSAIISEVLEHIETPNVALKTLFKVLRPGGRIFINIPVNSPAPDHIFLWRTTDEVLNLIKSIGFLIEEEHYFPPLNYTVDEARKKKLDISCIIIARKQEIL